MRALVVDDELTTRIVLEEILAPYGVVHTRVDGLEAVAACAQALDAGNPYDLVSLDLLMPNMGGLEALKLIRQDEERHGLPRGRGAKVVITTAAGDRESINFAFRELCDAYLLKPIDAAELLDVVYCLCPIDDEEP
jgi:two-component system chemotaxis response regulator CheY